MSIFGDLERVLADLYPYRIPLTLAGLVFAAAIGTVVVRRGWHRPAIGWIDGNRLPAALLAVVVLAVTLPSGYYLLSPLWERTTLVEASPLDSAVVASLGAEATTAPPSDATSGPPDAGSSSQVTGDTPTGDSTGTVPDGPRLIGRGSFEGADSFHFAEGQALIVETAPAEFVLRFEEFSIRNGPDLFVYLSSDPNAPSDDAVRLGGLKATDGAFNYEVPAGTDVSKLRYAMVWCDRFAVLFATAPLDP